MRKRIQTALLVSWVFCSPTFAAEVTRGTSVFEKPSFGSKQTQILPAKSVITVTGHEQKEEGESWVPVTTSLGSGWVPRKTLELEQNDMGYKTWPGKEEDFWIKGSVGPMGMSSDDFYYGLRSSLSLDWFTNHHRQFFAGATITSQFSKEKLVASFNGKAQRYNTYLSFGYYVLPGQAFVRYGLGLSILAGANRDFAQKFGASALGEIGYDFLVTNSTRWGVSFSYEYTGKSRQSMNFFQDLGHCIFGGCDASRPTPSASIFAINLNIGLAP